MKYIFINIKSFAQKNSLFFMLFIFCQIMSFAALLFSFGAFQNFKVVKNQKINQSIIDICFGTVLGEYFRDDGNMNRYGDGSVDNGSVKKLLSLLDEETLEDLWLFCYFPHALNTDLEYIEGYNGLGFAFRLKYSKEEKTFVQYGISSVSSGVTLTHEEFVNGTNKIVLPCDYNEGYLERTFHMSGKEYTVCGINYMDDFATMSFADSPDDMGGVDDITFYFNDLATRAQYDDIVSACKEVYGDYASVPEIDTVSDKLPFYNTIMAITVMLALLSAVTLMLLYKYILGRRSRTIAILRLHGCSRGKARRICIAEIMILTLLCALIAYGVYFGFILDELSTYLKYIKAVYSLKNIMIMFAINIAATYLITNIMIVRQLSAGPVNQLKER